MLGRHSWSVLILVSIIAALTACGTQQQSQTTKPLGIEPTVTLDNTAPSNLDLNFVVTLGHTNPTYPITLSITPGVTYQNKIVSFIHGEKFECGGNVIQNGESLLTNPIPSAGTVVPCTYKSPQGQASFSYTVPSLPIITVPVSGATVARSAQTPITFNILPGCKDVGTIVGSQRSDGIWNLNGQEGSGCIAQQTVNTAAMPVGTGTIGITENLQSSLITNNPGFHSFLLTVNARTVIPVTWQ